MKVLITGSNGQLGWELQQSVKEGTNIFAFDRSTLDISNAAQVKDCFASIKPDWVINAAAYTQVDQAENDADLAFAVNHIATENIALACKNNHSKLAQISTDFVFDGTQNTPYLPSATANPISVYGKSKYLGETSALSILEDQCLIIRTSWVYSAHGNNFVKKIINLMNQRDSLNIVADQIGSPTWAYDLANAVFSLIQKNQNGIQHWSDYGVASWYDFAIAIYEEATSLGLITTSCNISPISTEQYPTLATRPKYSVLSTTSTVQELSIKPKYWRTALRQMLLDLNNHTEKKNG